MLRIVKMQTFGVQNVKAVGTFCEFNLEDEMII